MWYPSDTFPYHQQKTKTQNLKSLQTNISCMSPQQTPPDKVQSSCCPPVHGRPEWLLSKLLLSSCTLTMSSCGRFRSQHPGDMGVPKTKQGLGWPTQAPKTWRPGDQGVPLHWPEPPEPSGSSVVRDGSGDPSAGEQGGQDQRRSQSQGDLPSKIHTHHILHRLALNSLCFPSPSYPGSSFKFSNELDAGSLSQPFVLLAEPRC